MTDDRRSDTSLDTKPPADAGPSLSLDTVFELLANQRRRFALYALTTATDGVMAFDALIEDVATLEAALACEGVTRDRYLDIAADFHHWHLAVLSDVGVADYDERSRTIRYRRHSRLETWVDRVRDDEIGSRYTAPGNRR